MNKYVVTYEENMFYTRGVNSLMFISSKFEEAKVFDSLDKARDACAEQDNFDGLTIKKITKTGLVNVEFIRKASTGLRDIEITKFIIDGKEL